ncbi:hypothetical protein A2V71_04615 [Candidatus Berkelbacteria bacterium RBG_13_40_8]|uniref:Type II/III secretion system secretin-like domain-containing protein n=1 Tax=Candidatus Berkelbacteria bacterium RBG_13_40_8 TaxID=1797467 RepID=A0A1F5DMY7_9BACT|nr:MAG: hypothetical protein A2V71_04615 [Candidatus Berkelbacteria bacterium RBG_13_40_8]
MRKWMLLLLILEILIFSSISFAQTPVDISTLPVDCSFTNMDASQVLGELAKQTGIDISVDPVIDRKINLIGKMTFGEAIDRICVLTNAISSRVDNKSIIVTTPNPKGVYFINISETEIVPIKFPPAKQVVALLASNPLSQYMTADDESNQISITAPRPIIDRLKAEIAKIDVEPPMMIYELSVIDTFKGDLKDAGFQIPFIQSEPDENGVITLSFQNTIVGVTSPYAAFRLFHYLAGNNVKILSQPTGMVSSGQKLYLYFGDDLAIITAIVSGSNVPGGLTSIKAGTEITVKPRFISPNKIELYIKGDVSQPVATFSSGNIVTRVARRSFETTVFLTDGETAFLGGMASKIDTITKSKVPILGDIPLIGGLFRSSHKETTNQEIIILLTLRLIKPGEVSPAIENLIKKTGGIIEGRKPNLEGGKTPSITEPTKEK